MHWILEVFTVLRFWCSSQQMYLNASEHFANSHNVFPTIPQATGERTWTQHSHGIAVRWASGQIHCKSTPPRHGRVFSGFPSVENKLFGGYPPSLPSCLCRPYRVQLIDKGFCPCHQGLMSFCQLPGSPVSHSALLFFSSSLPDRSLSPSPFFLTPPRRPPSPHSIRCPFPGRHSFVAWCQQAPLTSYCLNLSPFSKVTSAPSHKAPGGRSSGESHKLTVWRSYMR